MKDGICPKCSSDSVYTNTAKGSKYSYGISSLVLSVWRNPVAVDNYVCANCGYIECYISDKKALSYIMEKWRRVRTQVNQWLGSGEALYRPTNDRKR